MMTSAACRRQKQGPAGVSWASQLCDGNDGVSVPDRTFSGAPAAQALSPDHSLFCVCVQSDQLLPGPAKHFPAQRTGGKSAEASATYYVGEWVHRCGQLESSRPVGSGSQLGQLLNQQTHGQDINPRQVVSKHLERQVTVFRSQHGPVEGSQARLRTLPFCANYDWW